MKNNAIAFGAPGIEPRWTSSAKDGIGTAYHSSSRVWFTFSHGIINEIYFPYVDSPNTRNLQFLITDGESFCHEERRDLLHQTETPAPNALFYRLTNGDRADRVGSSDGWQDLMDNFKMDWEFEQVENGNIALLGESDLAEGKEFMLGVGFGHTPHSASTNLLQVFATPFADLREKEE